MTMETRNLLKRMVEIYSPSGDESELVDFLGPKMEELGYRTTRDEAGNLIGRIGQGDVTVLLVGHLDTVEGEIPVRVEDGVLHGRGSVDAKAPLASFVGAGPAFSSSESLEVMVAGAVEEETSSKGAYALVDEVAPDYVIVGEPSRWNGITLGYRGSTRINYSLEVPKTHRGEGSPLPAEEAVKFYEDLSDLLENDSNGFNSTDIRLTDFNTEDRPFKDVTEMSLDVRTSPGFEYEKLDRFIEENVGDASVARTRGIPPVKSSKRNKLVSSFLSGIRDQGGEPKFKLKTGTADMNIFAEHWNVPIVAYGPGDSSLDHTPEEHLELEELDSAEDVLVGALKVLENAATG